MIRRLILASILLSATACGGHDGPTGPTGNQVVDVAGVWAYVATVTSLSGGECAGAALQGALGAVDRGTMSITQTGATLRAVSRSNDGSSCTYTGTAGQSLISLGWQSCDASDVIGLVCANGARRDVRLQTNSINATINGASASGTQGQSYNVNVAGTTSGVGVLTLSATFTATR